MYKKFSVLLFSVVINTLVYAQCEPSWIELKPSYFFFTQSPMKDVYDKGGFQIQACASSPICYSLDLYGSIGFRKAWGHALNSCEETSLTVIPVDIGLKPVFSFCECYNYYFAFGPRYFYVHQHNCSPYVDSIINKSGIGFFVNTGFNVLYRDCFLIGLFAEYSYEKKKVCPQRPRVYSNGSVQIGGVAVGISVGYEY